MTDLGSPALLLALVVSGYSAIAAFLGKRNSRPELVDSARHGVYAVAGLLTLSSLALIWAMVSRDFQVEYVAATTSRSLPLIYTFSALWAGQAGSILFWAWILAAMSAAVVFQSRERNQELMPYVISTLMAVQFFFLLVAGTVTNPFVRLEFIPEDGQGMNPLLQNPWMLIHPVALYLGFVGFTVPFAFATAALLSGRLSDAWIRTTRRWTLFSWLLLSIGVGLGGQWAYMELGWGGFWGWDPVENASFLPWLTATAFLHSVMIQEKRGMLKVWNLVLIALTFLLAVFGTFLTRSGVLQSVHAFALGKVGPYFLGFLGAVAIAFILLLYERRHLLRSENQFDSVLSREAGFLLNNLLFVGATFAIFWGTIFPLLSEAVTGKKITVGPPFFNQVAGPIFLALVLLMGIGPLLSWRRTSQESLIRHFTYPVVSGFISAVLLFIVGVREWYALLAYGVAVFVAATIVSEFWRGTVARREMTKESWFDSFLSLVRRNRRRYGGYIVHLGIVLAAVGIAGSSIYKLETDAHLAPGETVTIQNYTLRFEELTEYLTQSHEVVAGVLTVYQGGRVVGTMAPEKNFHPGSDSPTTEAAIRSTPFEDLYVVLAGWEADGSATFKVTVNPLIMFLWMGWGVFIGGTVVAAWPDPREAVVQAPKYVREPAAQKA